ncbi:HTH-type transcriptional regulator ImmR [compost metagenome]
MTVGKRLKEARKGIFTQIQVAEILGIDDTTISKYENDKSEADNATLKKFSDLYKVNLHWILTGEGEKGLIEVSNERLTKEEMIQEIVAKAGEPGSKERDRLSEIFWDEYKRLPDSSKLTIIELMRQMQKKE